MHRRLKLVAIAFLWRRGYRVIGTEIAIGSHFRVDVAGCAVDQETALRVRVALIEVKATRADLLADLRPPLAADEAEAAREIWRVERDRRRARGEASRSDAEAQAWKRLRRLQDEVTRRSDGPKFGPFLAERSTDRFICAPLEIFNPADDLGGWGILAPTGKIARRATGSAGPLVAATSSAIISQIARRATWQIVSTLPGGGRRRLDLEDCP